MDKPGEVTRLLLSWSDGKPDALEELLPLVYGELRRLAGAYLRQERPEHTLQPTALVHEAYLQLVNQSRTSWRNRAHFYGIAAQAMRRILVDHARARGAAKRGGAAPRVSLDESIAAPAAPDVDVLALDAALTKLAAFDPDKSRIVELRFFGGLSVDEVAEVCNSSPRTVARQWQLARAWLYGEIVAGV